MFLAHKKFAWRQKKWFFGTQRTAKKSFTFCIIVWKLCRKSILDFTSQWLQRLIVYVLHRMNRNFELTWSFYVCFWFLFWCVSMWLNKFVCVCAKSFIVQFGYGLFVLFFVVVDAYDWTNVVPFEFDNWFIDLWIDLCLLRGCVNRLCEANSSSAIERFFGWQKETIEKYGSA